LVFYAFSCCHLLSVILNASSNELNYRHTQIKQQYFFRKKNEKKKEEKRICHLNSQCSGGSQGFLSKYYPAGCGDFDKNP